MTIAEQTPVRPPSRSASAGWTHFGIAAGVLLVTTIGWGWGVTQLQWALRKEPVPWPAGVTVSADCRLTSFPARIGPFVLAEDGELERQRDGQPDGDVIMREDVLESLHINTSVDKSRLAERQSNWYASRIYRDTRVDSGPFRYWRLDLYYYTGLLDTVPHVPERCAQAGGAQLAGNSGVTFALTGTPEPWDKAAPFRKTCYEITTGNNVLASTRRYVQYYTFSLNGAPQASWEMVRATLTLPTQRYCFFAKIQFGPAGEVPDFDETDAPAQEFIRLFMPAALATLPMPQDIATLAAAAKSKP
ncbi:MAG: hypothetical protein WC869_09480 [Phycisphaerae bacterium]